jgi:hypothetical protein
MTSSRPLESQGAIVMYVDLGSNTQASPASLVPSKIQEKLAELQDTGSSRRLSV